MPVVHLAPKYEVISGPFVHFWPILIRNTQIMKKSVLIYGSVLGIILAGSIFYLTSMVCNNPYHESNDLLGYAAQIIVFSLIFFGVRNYRNKFSGGIISFGKALKTGLLITLVGTSMYVVVWLFYYYLFVPDFLDYYFAHELYMLERNGADAERLARKIEQQRDFREMYQNPPFVILITYLEILPPGILVSLVSALILKRKSKKENPGTPETV